MTYLESAFYQVGCVWVFGFFLIILGLLTNNALFLVFGLAWFAIGLWADRMFLAFKEKYETNNRKGD